MTHGSLFAGIGGIDLGLEWAGFETAWQVENNEFCSAVLAKHWPNVQRFLDVRDVGKHNLKPVDLISGGFPCQDISGAAGGKEHGLHRERSSFWFEQKRIVEELKPAWVLIENVPNLKNFGADQVISDMEGAGYTCETSVVGVDAFGAPFQRRRVFILCRNNAYGDRHCGEDVASGWTLPPDVQRSLAQACEDWNHWKHELGTRDDGASGDSEESKTATYAEYVRNLYGLPDGLERLKAIGNSCTPVIPALIGSFIQNYEATKIPLVS